MQEFPTGHASHDWIMTRARAGEPILNGVEIPLADLDAAMAQDAVGSGNVEIEVWQAQIEQQRLTCKPALGAARVLDGDLFVLRAIDLVRP